MAAMKLRIFRDARTASVNSLVMAATVVGWAGSFYLMARPQILLTVLGVLLCAQSMVWAAYLIHEAAHQALFAGPRLNRVAGETASFIAGSSYASFERIRALHIRHHVDRADLYCFDYRDFIGRHPRLCRVLQALEWAYIPATEVLMHLQVIWRPLFVKSQRAHLPRAMWMLVGRGVLLVLLAIWSLKALLLYAVAYGLLLHALNFFDCFQHSFENFTVIADEPIPLNKRDRAYEHTHTYTNLISAALPVPESHHPEFCVPQRTSSSGVPALVPTAGIAPGAVRHGFAQGAGVAAAARQLAPLPGTACDGRGLWSAAARHGCRRGLHRCPRGLIPDGDLKRLAIRSATRRWDPAARHVGPDRSRRTRRSRSSPRRRARWIPW